MRPLRRAATRPKTAMVRSMGIMTLKESATAGGTPSPRLTFSLSRLDSLMKSVAASRAMMIAPNRPLAPVLVAAKAPVASTPVRA